ncbi:dTDP-glucose 4,6-dehydratase [Candidatus Azambacteria bacterium]|nr:dTDP-glucose 4,6-dehydratase [Candidatus Azambacteria bacterium]
MQLLVTGGAGFIGSNFILYWLREHPADEIINFDKLTYAGNLENLASVANHPRYAFIRGDICDREAVREAMKGVDVVVHFAAESHVDRSILDPSEFIKTNVLGTQVLLDEAVRAGLKRFHHISTDEVFGALALQENRKFTEESLYRPNSPYAASKAGADLLVRAYEKTYGLAITITNCSNNYGPYQFPEKFIPLMIINALEEKPLPVYGDGLNVRDWIHVEDHCRAIDLVLEKGRVGETYCIGGDSEKANLEVVKEILKILEKPESLIRFVKDRPAHDRRYAIDATKIKTELGFTPKRSFVEGLRETIRWYQANENWWQRVMRKEYLEYYEKQYAER